MVLLNLKHVSLGQLRIKIVYKYDYFLTRQSKHMFWVFKRAISSRRSFEYPQHMFWLRNKKNNFLLHTLISGPDVS